MKTIVKKCPLRDGESVLLEVHCIRLEGEEADAGVKERTLEYLNETWETLRPALAAMMGQLKELGPESIQVKFGVKVSTELRAIIAGSAAEANFEITMGWNRA